VRCGRCVAVFGRGAKRQGSAAASAAAAPEAAAASELLRTASAQDFMATSSSALGCRAALLPSRDLARLKFTEPTLAAAAAMAGRPNVRGADGPTDGRLSILTFASSSTQASSTKAFSSLSNVAPIRRTTSSTAAASSERPSELMVPLPMGPAGRSGKKARGGVKSSGRR
jgi:hypothetical protein